MTVSASPALPGQDAAARHAPLVCGALGPYDRDRVQAIATAFGGNLRPAHEDERSMLMLDREPLRWSGSRERGLAWIQGSRWRPGARTWQETSGRGACGLVLDGRRRFLHSSINGIGPLYWMRDRGCVYFASRIDPLVQAHQGALSVDWDAWAAIVALRYPLGENTPFEEIKRLRLFSTIGLRLGRVRRRSPRWPWADLGSDTDLDTGAEAVATRIEEALASVETLDVCPLSGGKDSRMLLSAAVKVGWSPTALTVSDDEGGRFEQDLAAPVATALGVRHEMLDASIDEYPEEWELRAAAVEYQFVDHAWLVPLARRIDGIGSTVPDGFALDSLLKRGTHFYGPETRNRRHPRRATEAMFGALRRYGDAPLGLAEPIREPLLARVREQFLAEVRDLEGHPWQAELSLYSTRTVRGISCYPSGLLGARAEILIPGASNALATAVLSVDPLAKDGDRLYEAVLGRFAPSVQQLPSTNETPRAASHLPRRWCSEPALADHRRRLAEGPLAAHVSPELQAWIAAPEGELSPDLRLGMEGISLFHAWWGRYREKLREADVAELWS